jgi:SAM-dependent methyltransferase
MRQLGSVRIFLYNWPTYVGTWTLALLLVGAVSFLPSGASAVVLLGATVAILWSLISILVSFYVYDASELVAARWVPALLGREPHAWAMVHAGLDEELKLDAVLSCAPLARLDIFDPRFMSAPSIERARALTPSVSPATRCSPTELALADDSCEAIVVAFSAHEVRDRSAREAFFRELRRALRPGGRALVVEHLRDFANFFAYGPGFLHFVAHREWLRLARMADLTVSSERRVTPFVMALTLEKAP